MSSIASTQEKVTNQIIPVLPVAQMGALGVSGSGGRPARRRQLLPSSKHGKQRPPHPQRQPCRQPPPAQATWSWKPADRATLWPPPKRTIAFEIDGKLAELDVKLGDKVEKGQLLAKLDDASLQYKLEEAQLALLELTSPEAIANAKLAVTTAEANVITAQTALNNQQYWQNAALNQRLLCQLCHCQGQSGSGAKSLR